MVVGGWMGGVGVGRDCLTHTHICKHAGIHIHIHTHMLNMLKIHVKKFQMANSMGASIIMFNISVCVHACVDM